MANDMAKTQNKREKDSGYSNALVIVESPAKAKTIGKYLGQGYTVEASIGHVRDLPEGAKQIPAKYKDEPWKNLALASPAARTSQAPERSPPLAS